MQTLRNVVLGMVVLTVLYVIYATIFDEPTGKKPLRIVVSVDIPPPPSRDSGSGRKTVQGQQEEHGAARNSSLKGRAPNILFILLDEMGWTDAGYLGSKFYETPNIDKLAADGISFTNAYANSHVCAPSRASLLSGQYGPRHQVYTIGAEKAPHAGEAKERKLEPAKVR